MRLAITGSIATDHLMTFPGRFADSLVVEQLDKISLSFLVEDLQVRRGGIAANIAFGLANLGLRPVLVGAVGQDFVDYRSWLERHGVDTSHVLVSELAHTARFVCTTDADHAQIASFYAGAMSEARDIELGPIAAQPGGLDLVVISPNDPEAMLRHTEECRSRGLAFVADPSQQLAWMDGDQIRQLVDGAAYLFTNAYEAALIEQKTGWSHDDVMARVGVRVTTLGREGAKVETVEGEVARVTTPAETRRADPTGVGDAFRAGYLAGLSWGVGPQRCAELGSMLATYVVETVGTQEYELGATRFLQRFAEAYGADAADEVRRHVRTPRA
ncbi:MAG TPA: carbohydrate kinase family protein [Actinomycetales bacterium]|nr:carbohydrate kinase family protein [Actinomycetales bacterium]